MTDGTIASQAADERLNDIFQRLMSLYERHMEERQLFIKEKEELTRLIQLLIGQTKELGKYEEGIRKRIQETIQQSTNTATKNIEEIVTTHANQVLNQSISKLDSIVKDLNVTHDRVKSSKLTLSWQTISIGVLCGVLSSLAIIILGLSKPTLPLTAQEISYLHNGQMLVQIWPKLSENEKSKIKKLASQVSI